MVITNFGVRRLTPAETKVVRVRWADKDFLASGDYWLITFDLDGKKQFAGVTWGRRVDIADDIEQFQINLRVKDEDFDDDVFIPESQVADITRALSAEFEKGEYWKIP